LNIVGFLTEVLDEYVVEASSDDLRGLFADKLEALIQPGKDLV